ncbi:hypothetical protein [Argonema antarcticum]|uniref:hypothetical protein n=1 Tax=Argonema antarcticum TaxID=2942763 RepID=UPI0020129148|nr:hypothetical protein [Argonema antarcticum]MCL1475595.1 hypothetical protein [Argonema antarcticum A004/B2]
MEKATEETAVNLMQLMLDEDWVREAVRIEEEAGCDIGAGFDLGANLGEFLQNPAGFARLLELRSLIMSEFLKLLASWDLGASMEAAVACGRQLLMERLLHPSPEAQQQLLAMLLSQELTAEAETTKKDDPELRFLVRSILTHSDWDAIATAAANAIREQVMRQQVGV